MNQKHELPTSESTELEPLASALVALRREEAPLAPSVELRRAVEARLDEIETSSQGKSVTKEQVMLKDSTSRFRLRDWVFFAGGSVAAAVATAIIFWPLPKTNVAMRTDPMTRESTSKNLVSDFRKSGFESHRQDVTLYNGQSPSTTSSTSPEKTHWPEGEKAKMEAMMKFTADKAAQSSAGGPSGSGGGIPGSGITGGPGMGGGMGPGGMAGMPGIGGGPGGVGGGGGMLPGMPGGKGGYQPGYLVPDGGKYAGASSSAPQAADSFYVQPDSRPAKSPADPANQLAMKGKEASATTSPAPVQANGNPQNDLSSAIGGVTGTGVSGRGDARRMVVQGGTSTEGGERFRLAVRDKRSGSPQDEGLVPLSQRLDGKDHPYYFGARFQTDSLSGEQYNTIVENQFLAPTSEPLSTFSIDVDTASYSNVRRMLTGGQLPPPAAVRIEEMVNYFGYHYAQPKGKEPFAVNMETAECPWNPGHLLLRVGLKGKEIERKARPASNLVFLLDVSGSMSDENKLPLLKTTMTMLINELTENDRVTIVTYAGDAGLKLEPTSGDQKQKITDVISSLSAGGSTNGSAGIELAYQKATEAFIKEGTNRVILATDGDLNVGVTSDDALVKLIKEKAAGGTFLTVLGFGEGNLKDGKLEQIADNGNGMYGYIDSVREGRKMMVEQLSGSLVTIAKDVKIQIEFNPAQIQSYRLLGYENRVMAAADFNNDKKDAGEIGAGHTVTALYELVPVVANEKPQEPRPDVEPLKYQKALFRTAVPAEPRDPKVLSDAAATGELLTLKLRYKEPDGVESRLIEFPLKERGKQFNSASKDFQFAAAVASFGMILRGSQHRGSSNSSAVAEIAAGAIGEDPSGLRAEFVDLVRRAERLGVK